jgi:hypothetical protein
MAWPSRRARAAGAAAALLAGAFAGAPARADDAQTAKPAEVPIEVTVLRVSDEPGDVDPRAEAVDRLLRGQIPYRSLSVVDTYRRDLPVDEVWIVELPTEQELQLRPLDVSRNGTLISLDVEDGLQGDFRVRPGQPLIVGGPRYGDGKLVFVVGTE